MRVSTLLKFNALCNLFFGLFLLFIPHWMMNLFGVNLDAGGIYLARMTGGSFLGYAALTWLSRDLPEEPLRAVILPALFIWFAVGILTLLFGQLTRVTNFLGWFTILLSAFFTTGYAYFLIRPTGQKRTQPAAGEVD